MNNTEAPTKTKDIPCIRCGGSGTYTDYHGDCFRCGGYGGADPTIKDWEFPASWTNAQITEWTEAHDAKLAKAAAKAEVKRLKVLHANYAAHEGLQAAHESYNAQDDYHNGIVSDILFKAFSFLLSDAQVALVTKILADKVTNDAKRAQDDESKVAIPSFEGRTEITGLVLKTDWRDSDWGTTKKALLKVTHGDGFFMLWGSVPSAILEVERGDTVTFTARLSVSDDDESFGFWSRPTKATRVVS